MFNDIEYWIKTKTGLGPDLQWKIFSILSLLVLFWVIHVAIQAILTRKIQDPFTLARWKTIATYGVVFATIIVSALVWFGGVGDIITLLGFFTAGLAVALAGPLSSIAAWFTITTSRIFMIGDRIQIGDNKGDVIDQNIMIFTLAEVGNWIDGDQNTGRIINIPNNKIFSNYVANYSRGFQYLWNEIPVTITYESNWQKASGILEEIANKHSEQFTLEMEESMRSLSDQILISFTGLKPSVYVKVNSSSVELTIRYICEIRQRRETQDAIWRDVLVRFANENDIDFAYNTERIYFNPLEGKEGAKKPDLLVTSNMINTFLSNSVKSEGNQ